VLETLGNGVARRNGCPFALSPVPGKVLAGAVVLLKVRLAKIWATWFTVLIRCARALILAGSFKPWPRQNGASATPRHWHSAWNREVIEWLAEGG
jgi:hypothetical protein